MNTEDIGFLDTLIQDKFEADTDFHESISSLSDDEKNEKIRERKAEMLEVEIKTLKEKADKATKADELANNYKARAERIERELKQYKTGDKSPNNKSGDELSTKDLYALMSAKVEQEDVDEVVKAAKLLNKDISEAVKDPIVIKILETRAEFRKTADATNISKSRTGTKAPTNEEILRGLSEGKVPEKGSQEAEALFWAKRGGKR